MVAKLLDRGCRSHAPDRFPNNGLSTLPAIRGSTRCVDWSVATECPATWLPPCIDAKLLSVDTVTVIITTLGGALSATLGVLVGGLVTRRVQERHWLRDKQLSAYEELFSQYARFMMALRRGHLARTPVDVDWAAWSVSLTSASLVAPLSVARAISSFGNAVGVFLGTVAARDPVTDPVDEEGLTEASRPAAVAHLALLNAIRRSMGGSLEQLPFYLGGTVGRHPEGTDPPRETITPAEEVRP
ncbi:hypothetical protein ABNF97_13955 [Plantactinospora sp. B6F1]|uniref:hypothetical protein n=1 Tax=Plantactinospora sp. B6F1 TaxID=3158971 RepID=UPI0032D8D15F